MHHTSLLPSILAFAPHLVLANPLQITLFANELNGDSSPSPILTLPDQFLLLLHLTSDGMPIKSRVPLLIDISDPDSSPHCVGTLPEDSREARLIYFKDGVLKIAQVENVQLMPDGKVVSLERQVGLDGIKWDVIANASNELFLVPVVDGKAQESGNNSSLCSFSRRYLSCVCRFLDASFGRKQAAL
jgi:hypothetical protein